MTNITPSELADKITGTATTAAATFAESLISKASDVHPALSPIVSAIIQMAMTEENVEKMKEVIENLLVEIMGDDYPVIVDAGVVEFIDERTDAA